MVANTMHSKRVLISMYVTILKKYVVGGKHAYIKSIISPYSSHLSLLLSVPVWGPEQ